MKKLLIPLLALFTASAYASDPKISTHHPYCTSGKILYVKHNTDNTLTVKVNNKELYTNRNSLHSMLFSAYLTGATVHIYTKDCFNGGGFAEVVFY